MEKKHYSKIKIIRRLGALPGLTSKTHSFRKDKTPGQHGKPRKIIRQRSSLSDDFRTRLIEKQRARINYGIREKKLFQYYKLAKKQGGVTGKVLISILESRLDCILYRLGYAKTIRSARQLITHSHVLVNNKKVNIPGFLCKLNDIISIKKETKVFKAILKDVVRLMRYQSVLKRRRKKLNMANLKISISLPAHLKRSFANLEGTLIKKIKKKDILIKVHEQKILEYYS